MPPRAALGSPGINRISPKVMRVTSRTTGIAPTIRRRMTRPKPLSSYRHQPSIQTLEKRGMRKGLNPFTLARVAWTLVSEPNGTA